MSITEKMTALAGEIRAKTGLTDPLSLEQMAIDVAAAPSAVGEAPCYVRDEAARVAAKVSSLQHAGTLSFVCLTDLHIDHENTASALHACQAAALIRAAVPSINFVASLGDAAVGAYYDDKDTHIANLMAALRVLAVASPDVRLDGNHDSNIYSADVALSARDLYRRAGRFNSAAVNRPETETERNYFYLDIADKTTRVICLNTADLKEVTADDPQDGHYISAAQLAWLAEALDMTGKDGWRVLVLSHHPLHWYGAMTNVLTVLDAYAAGQSGSVTVDGETVAFDFSGRNAAELVGTFHGHTHNLISGKAGTSSICYMGTPNACASRNNEYGSDAYGEGFRKLYGETVTYAKTGGTAQDTAFCVYTVDFDAQLIYATCYGAGYDRVMSYAGETVYAVTNMLTNVTSDNASAALRHGDSYTATLTADGGCAMDTVTVIMGGEDVTDAVYENGVVTIAAVTGNIVITAAGVPLTAVLDMETIGYSDGYRLSTSTGALSAAEGYTVTGMIDLFAYGKTAFPVTVTVSGVGFDRGTHGYCWLHFYDADGNNAGVGVGTTVGTAETTHTVVENDDGSISVTVMDALADKTQYCRLCMYGSGAAAVIVIS